MRAVWYEKLGPAQEGLQAGEMPDPQPGPGEVRVRIAYSGVNPSDVKRRAGSSVGAMPFPRVIPDMDGSGIIDRAGPGVDPKRVGERVWLHSTQWKRPYGTAADYVATPSGRAISLPENVSMEAAASLGVPAMTAHRAVFGPGPVTGKTVLVTGGGGGGGHVPDPWAVDLVVRHVDDRGARARERDHALGQLADRHALGRADVEDL